MFKAIRKLRHSRTFSTSEQAQFIRSHSRFTLLEALEERVLLSANDPHALFAPDTPREIYEPYLHHEAEFGVFTFEDNDRWTSTAVNGGGLGQGDSTTLLWSIVPDGTSIHGYNGEPTSSSSLFAWLDGIYGADASTNAADHAWFSLFESMFDRWDDVSGLNYAYVNEQTISDWTPGGVASGQVGVRGDVRISAHPIDGNSNVLAYNFFPNGGDMVLDANDSFYNDTSINSLKLRNVLAHEHGHGVGMPHTDPVNQTKLMEPFLTTAFDGPQLDDILAANRGYGDNLEEGAGNDTSGTAHALGDVTLSTITIGDLLDNASNLNPIDNDTATVEALSIDDNSDADFFSFEITQPQTVTFTATPEGFTYDSGPQDGSTNPFNAKAQSNLALEVYDTDGSTLLLASNTTGVGQAEVAQQTFASSGTYFVRVSGNANAAQMYQLDLQSTLPVDPTEISGVVFGDANGNGILEAGENGLANWTVFLDENGNGLLDDITANSNHNSTNVPLPIDASGAVTVRSDVTVSGVPGQITDVNVTLDVTHTWDDDLDVFLIASDGTTVELFTDVGGSGDNFTNTTLDDEAVTAITSGSAPFTGSFSPEGSLSFLDGKNPNGLWTLEVNDDAAADGGSLNSWSIAFETNFTEVSTQTDSGGNYNFVLPGAGTYTVGQVAQAEFPQTSPTGGVHVVTLATGDSVTGLDFGNRVVPEFYFVANRNATERELFSSDGTESGTSMTRNLNSTASSNPQDLVLAGDRLFFTAQIPSGERELFSTFGTSSSTQLVRNLSGNTSSDPQDLIYNPTLGLVFFSAVAPDGQRELYTSDGTAAGTQRVANLSGLVSADPERLTNLDGTVYFVASLPTGERELHKSDGTAAGTMLVANLSGGDDAAIEEPVAVGSTLFFTALRANGERELFQSQGTPATTGIVRNLDGDPQPMHLTESDGVLFFSAVGIDGNRELYKSDGTSSGTVMVKNLAGATSSDPQQLTDLNGTLYFTSQLLNGQRELFASDGSAVGTALVRNLNGTTSSDPQALTVVNNTLFFSAERTSGERELHMSDGTLANTKLVRNLSGTSSSNPLDLTAVGNLLYFTAELSNGQRELFRSDGTSIGTIYFKNLAGSVSSEPILITPTSLAPPPAAIQAVALDPGTLNAALVGRIYDGGKTIPVMVTNSASGLDSDSNSGSEPESTPNSLFSSDRPLLPAVATAIRSVRRLRAELAPSTVDAAFNSDLPIASDDSDELELAYSL